MMFTKPYAMSLTRKYLDTGFKKNPVKKSLPVEPGTVINDITEQHRHATVIQRAYRSVRYSPSDLPKYKNINQDGEWINGTYVNDTDHQRCIVYYASPEYEQHITWYAGVVLSAPRKGYKYAVAVGLSDGWWDREYYYSDPEFRKEVKKIGPKLGRIVGVFLIKP